MGGHEKTYFEQQREALIGEIAMARHVSPYSFEHVLANINKLNRSLEAVTAVWIAVSFNISKLIQMDAQVGNEFSSVEALWSQFENVMDKDGKAEGETEQADQTEHHEEEGDTTVKHEGA
ncbi:DASH complex subunit DAD1 [Fusarium mexicanum]|uniref:DASH complex subunit DAD1 n=1 Tax=Fusarium mexicanum TaxID=751941 RepID=A0A8H5ITC8_9HYPO|nr:DASH complex subunit DAD1 [Fusarium mexicanum]